MRGLWIIVVLVACHHADAPAPAAAKGPTACARASDNMVQAMLDRLAKDAPPTEEADALRNLIRERCEHDGWSQEATSCLIAMKRLEDADACAKFMTDDQQAALVRDEDARLGAAPPGSPESSAPARNAAPGPAGAAAPAPEPAHNAAPAADPAAAPAARTAPAAAAPALQSAPPPPPGVAPKAPAKPGKSKGKGAAEDPCSGGQ